MQDVTKDNICLITTDKSTETVIKTILKQESYYIEVLSDHDKTIETLTERTFSLFIVDFFLTSKNGLIFSRTIRHMPGYEGTPIILISSLILRPQHAKTISELDLHIFRKPFKSAELRRKINEVLIHELEDFNKMV